MKGFFYPVSGGMIRFYDLLPFLSWDCWCIFDSVWKSKIISNILTRPGSSVCDSLIFKTNELITKNQARWISMGIPSEIEVCEFGLAYCKFIYSHHYFVFRLLSLGTFIYIYICGIKWCVNWNVKVLPSTSKLFLN